MQLRHRFADFKFLRKSSDFLRVTFSQSELSLLNLQRSVTTLLIFKNPPHLYDCVNSIEFIAYIWNLSLLKFKITLWIAQKWYYFNAYQYEILMISSYGWMSGHHRPDNRSSRELYSCLDALCPMPETISGF